jgi:hypothetical protein
MAKDAKGHGSEARSGHEHAIAKDTVKNPMKGLFLGGPTAEQAEAKLRGRFGYSDKEISNLKGGPSPVHDGLYNSAKAAIGGGQPVESNAHAAATLASGAKSAPVPVHGGATGSDAEHLAAHASFLGVSPDRVVYSPGTPGAKRMAATKGK